MVRPSYAQSTSACDMMEQQGEAMEVTRDVIGKG